jgi:hypothetical protein
MTNKNPSSIQFFPVNFTGNQTDHRRTSYEKARNENTSFRNLCSENNWYVICKENNLTPAVGADGKTVSSARVTV